MNYRIILSVFLIFLLLLLVIFYPKNKEFRVTTVVSPIEFVLNNQNFKYNDVETFDNKYSEHNKDLGLKFNLSEDEAFILGNLANYWAKNILLNRKVSPVNDDIIYYKFSYKTRFENSPFCIKNGNFTNEKAFLRQLNSIRKSKFVIVDIDTDSIYPISKENAEKIKNFVVVRKTHVKNINTKEERNAEKIIKIPSKKCISGNLKIFLSDLTTQLKPNRNCNTDICREILSNIKSAQHTIDMAIYGYSSTPAIEEAIKDAIKRGVQIRLVCDSDKKGENIYPDTNKFVKLIPQNISDINSSNPEYIMHNKFYIFDNETVISGSANLSHTDMSGFNTNSVIVIKSPNIAKIYKEEFEQMYSNKFHKDKPQKNPSKIDGYTVSFSPQNSTITNVIIPAIKNAKKYIYIPTFVITEKRVAEELVNAKMRGVDVRIILDALNASVKHSKHRELRQAGIQVKTENYAGKMHSKSMIIDDKYIILGSMNFSNSGENKNDENIIFFENPDVAKFYKQFFLYQWDKIPDKWLKYNVRAESKDSVGSCSDGIDNDYDGLIDSDDEGCK